MSVSVATQTTTFLPASPPVLEGRKLSKRFFARMKHILSRDLNKGKKIAKEQKTVYTEIRYIMTHMGIIANDNKKYYKNLAKNKLKRSEGKKIAKEQKTVSADKEEKAAKKAQQLADKEEKAAKKAQQLADKKAQQLADKKAQQLATKEEKTAKKAQQLADKEEKAAKKAQQLADKKEKAELERRIAEKAKKAQQLAAEEEKAELERRNAEKAKKAITDIHNTPQLVEEADEETYEDYIEDNYGSDVEVDEPVY